MRSVEEIKADIKRHENRLGNLDFNQDDERCHIQIAEHELRWTLTSAIPLDRLEALCAAEREGRCVVLPVKPGDSVVPFESTGIAPQKVEAVTLYANGRVTLDFHEYRMVQKWVDEWSEGDASDYTRVEAEAATRHK